MYRSVSCFSIAFFAAACALPAAPPPRAPAISVTRARFENFVGQQVRWGGKVASVTPTESQTCFEIVDRPLDSGGEPLDSAQRDGRFLACTPQFYARGVYEGQDVTVTGTLETPVTEKLDDLKYRYPRVAITELHFWPPPEDVLANRTFPRRWQPWGTDLGLQGYWW
ncbi:MAG: Slp family lipoprotein [Candidatus Binatia bacterium]